MHNVYPNKDVVDIICSISMCMAEKKSSKFSVRFAAVEERNKANMCSPNRFLLLKHEQTEDKALGKKCTSALA
jgi:hypothetical protein